MRCVLPWLDSWAAKKPDAAALEDEKTCLTWRQLHDTAKRIGTYLARQLPPRVPVALCMDKSPMTVAAMLGVLEAGCFYTIIDVQMPQQRVQLILDALHPALLLTDAGKAPIWADAAGKLPCVSTEAAASCDIDESLLAARQRDIIDTDLQYVLFTSGSTGYPKGVAIRHRSVLDFVEWAVPALRLDETVRFGNQAPLYFDNSVLDIFCTLKSGAYVYFLPQKDFLFPARMMDELEQRQINTLFWVPSALMHPANLGVVKDGRPRGIKRVFFCGEVMPNRQLNIWRRSLPDADFVNMYGPTEITDVCSWYRVDRAFEDGEPLPIGFPCENTRITLVDGEICVSGTCLSAGYYNAPEKTAAAFVQHPDARGIPERMYKTGDLGAYNERGELMFLGRKDSQIKKQGYRIELGEIECAIKACQAVTQGCCFYQAATQQIVCCYSGEDDEKALRGELRRRLPKYMLPDVYYHLPQFPQTMNGKIDRVRLRQELGL